MRTGIILSDQFQELGRSKPTRPAKSDWSDQQTHTAQPGFQPRVADAFLDWSMEGRVFLEVFLCPSFKKNSCGLARILGRCSGFFFCLSEKYQNEKTSLTDGLSLSLSLNRFPLLVRFFRNQKAATAGVFFPKRIKHGQSDFFSQHANSSTQAEKREKERGGWGRKIRSSGPKPQHHNQATN